MVHNWEKYFDLTSPYWSKLQELYAANDHYPKTIVHDRELHHKFMRTFSRMEGTPVDNDPDNLVSLSPQDHLRAHFYLWKCTLKGYGNRTAPPVRLMIKKALTKIEESTIEAVIQDWDDRVLHLKNPKLAEFNKSRRGKKQSLEHVQKVRAARKKYDVPVINIFTLEEDEQRKGRTLFFNDRGDESHCTKNTWLKMKDIDKINNIIQDNVLSLDLDDRLLTINCLHWLYRYWKNDPLIIDRIIKELSSWY